MQFGCHAACLQFGETLQHPLEGCHVCLAAAIDTSASACLTLIGLGLELTALPRALHTSGACQLTNRRCLPGHVSPPCHPLAEEECDHFVEESCRDAYRDQVLIAVNRVLKAEGRQVQYRKPGFKMPAGGEPDFGAYATTGPPDSRHTFVVGEAKASACRVTRQILGSG